MCECERELGPLLLGAPHLGDAGLCFHILEALLQHGYECARGNHRAIDARLVHVTLQAKCEGSMLEPCGNYRGADTGVCVCVCVCGSPDSRRYL